jgi:hypothetical protein
MNLLNREPPAAPLPEHEKFFLELWHGMTHEASLDSHRVRCLNARTIIRELKEEIEIGRARTDDILALCKEAEEILESDPVVGGSFPRHVGVLKPLLAKPPLSDEKKKDAAQESAFREFRFAVADFSAVLEEDYFKRLLAKLPEAISDADFARIDAFTGAVLSDLIDQGWPIETLFSWPDLFFREKNPPYNTFASNLNFMIRNLEWGNQSYSVILRLSGSSKLSEFGDFNGFHFRSIPGFIPDGSLPQRKFAAQSSLTTFAETEVDAPDFTAAAIAARERFERCLDLLRFNFEPEPLKVDTRCLVKRKGDGRMRLPEVRHLVPNPHHHLHVADFRQFTKQIEEILARPGIQPESRERLRAGLRHFRIGSDADTYKDKFLSWWMGLEFLAHVGVEGNIGPTVASHVSDTLVQRYLYKFVSDLVRTLNGQKVVWSEDLAQLSGAATLDDLDHPKCLTILHSQHGSETLAAAFPRNPVAARRIRRLAEMLQNPLNTADAVAAHHRHLRWHLSRLYWVRCCIVHGSEVRHRLPLLTANLEFYLKELITILLRAFSKNPHLTSLAEIYQRAGIARERSDRELRAQESNADSVRRTVFNSIVLQEIHPS